MIAFLTITMKESKFLLNELQILRPFFADEQTFEIDETSLRLFTPPKDANGDYDKVQCFEVFKRIVFKLAAAFERVYLFTQDRVRARSYNLEVFEVDI